MKMQFLLLPEYQHHLTTSVPARRAPARPASFAPDPGRASSHSRSSRMERYGAQGGMGGYSGYGGMTNNAAQPAGSGTYGGDGSANLQLQQLLLQQLQGTSSQSGATGSLAGQSDPYAADRQAPYDPYAPSGEFNEIESN